ncbi:DUF2357 domain-containing protein [Flavihumibacter stibioxidans]|uniref:DUF2357 domain-containing protein n=1 Tax=Flavihumibacter stibioxidans TaxID=1834163 RepID=A0ABR7M8M6_9BACT|nr:DUF2357 domain-containing protein [Flavihumibacter stibioxidans]MBC6491385.1 hypothetical protein [Flavihumibacter stibioxidans]
MKSVTNIEINLETVKEGLRLWIEANRPDSLFDAEELAHENNEARFQLLEGCTYDYEINDSNYRLGDVGENIVQQHKRNTSLGSIAPNIFVGTLSIPLLEKNSSQECCKIELEIQSVKAGYRDDYRDMLELITEKCTDLLLQASSPVSQHFDIDYTKDSQSIYQKFAFIKSVIGTNEFAEAVHRILTSPVTKWKETTEENDIRNARRFSNTNIKEILKGGKRTKIPHTHYLRNYGIETLPERITTIRKADSVDTPENRFIKHALEIFLKFCTDINKKAKEFGHKKMETESEILIQELDNQLHHTVFKQISRPNTLKLNSPILQRKEGYREVLRVWLMFDLAAKLVWTGGDDIYSGGKKDIATLYEYWLFFKLLDLFQSIFDIDPKDISELIKETSDGLNLQIKQGKFTALSGIYNSGARKLNVRFNYNRSFTGRKNYPDSGSWTTTLRPDYTLSFWPLGITEDEAEKQELIVHVHFDAKYKIAPIADYIEQNTENDLDEEKAENRKGIYKNADLLKMHAYKDAIRRTGGAYVLYPGGKTINHKGFHEIIPGLGAFPVKPSKSDSGIGELKAFILEIIDHFLNRASQREKVAYRAFEIYKKPPDSENIINEPLPEPFNTNRDLIPDETFILVGYYKSTEQFSWITRNRLYNFRIGSAAGSLILDKETVSSKYLLLHTTGNKVSGELWKIVSIGPKVYSKDDLIKKGYPSPSQDNYLVIQLEPVTDPEFDNASWNFRNLKNYSIARASAYPFTTSLTELMKNKIR